MEAHQREVDTVMAVLERGLALERERALIGKMQKASSRVLLC